MSTLITTDAKSTEMVKATIFSALYSQFWNSNGAIISKWLRGEKLEDSENTTFKNYLLRVSKLYLPDSINDIKTKSIDDIANLLLESGVDAL